MERPRPYNQNEIKAISNGADFPLVFYIGNDLRLRRPGLTPELTKAANKLATWIDQNGKLLNMVTSKQEKLRLANQTQRWRTEIEQYLQPLPLDDIPEK